LQGNLSWRNLKQLADPTLASLPLYPEYETGIAACYGTFATSYLGYVRDFGRLQAYWKFCTVGLLALRNC